MKVLITTDWYKPAINGVVTSVCNLREELQQRGHEVKILTLSRTARSYEEEGVIYMGSVNAGYIYPGARLRVSPGRELYRGIIEWNPDIVHSQCEFSTFFMAKKIAEECKMAKAHFYLRGTCDHRHHLYLWHCDFFLEVNIPIITKRCRFDPQRFLFLILFLSCSPANNKSSARPPW